jgi:hypothetical protein
MLNGLRFLLRKQVLMMKLLIRTLSIFLLAVPLFWNPVSSATESGNTLAPEVTLTVNEEFFNAFLDSMFTNLKPVSAPLAITAADKERKENYGCASVITLQRDQDGVRTAIKLEQNKITAPLAFSGSYDSTLLGCIEFRGWANTTWNLEFDRTRQALLARIQVQDIHLSNVPALAGGSLAKIVQGAIDQRINPLELIKLEQMSTRVPIAPAGGALRLRAKDASPEIVPGSLRVHVTYEVVADR